MNQDNTKPKFFKRAIATPSDYLQSAVSENFSLELNGGKSTIFSNLLSKTRRTSGQRHCAPQLTLCLEEENAGYRFVGFEIAQITDIQEIDAIEEAVEIKYDPIAMHSKRALELISNRHAPDYRNSIKESISAVEAAARLLTGKKKATLDDCLKVPDERRGLHPSFKQALSMLYGFTSDSGGIRHAFSGTEPTFADAKFMLVACTAFVNFLLTKAATLGPSPEKAPGETTGSK